MFFKSFAANIAIWSLLLWLPGLAIQRPDPVLTQWHAQEPEPEPYIYRAPMSADVQIITQVGESHFEGLSEIAARHASEDILPLRTVWDLPHGKTAFLKIDWNLYEQSDGTLEPTKIYQTLTTLRVVLNKYKRVFIATRFGPVEYSDVSDVSSVSRILDVVRPILKEEKIDAEIVLLKPELDDVQAQVFGVDRTFPDTRRIFVFENMRRYWDEGGERAQLRQAFADRLKALSQAEVFINEAFGELTDPGVASMNELAALFEPAQKAAGVFLAQELYKLKSFQTRSEDGPMFYIYGGNRWHRLRSALRLIDGAGFKEGDAVAIVGALAHPVLEHLGFSVGLSELPSIADHARADLDRVIPRLVELMDKKKDFLVLTEDHIAEDGANFQVISGRRVPDEVEVTSIGTHTQDALAEKIRQIRTGGQGGIVMTGVVSRIDSRLSRQWGTTALLKQLEAAAVIDNTPVFLVGRQINEAVGVIQRKDRQGKPFSIKLLRTQSGDGVLAALAQGIETLKPVQALLKDPSEDIKEIKGSTEQAIEDAASVENAVVPLDTDALDLEAQAVFVPALAALKNSFKQAAGDLFHARRLERAIHRQTSNPNVQVLERALLDLGAREILGLAIPPVSIIVGDTARQAENKSQIRLLEEIFGRNQVFTIEEYLAGEVASRKALFVVTQEEQATLGMGDLTADIVHRTKDFEELRICRCSTDILSALRGLDRNVSYQEHLNFLQGLARTIARLVDSV